jgi:predicted RNA-binding protein with TRAM domain
MVRRRARRVGIPWLGRREGRTTPIKEGEILEVCIEGIDHKGRGMARVEGRTILVPGAKVGDKLKVKIEKIAGGLITASPAD